MIKWIFKWLFRLFVLLVVLGVILFLSFNSISRVFVEHKFARRPAWMRRLEKFPWVCSPHCDRREF